MPALRPSHRLALLALVAAVFIGVGAAFWTKKHRGGAPTATARPESGSVGTPGTPARDHSQPAASGSPRAAAPHGPPAAAAGGPIPVEVEVLRLEAFETPIPATGTLLPRESVTIVSELSRRLVRVRAEEGKRVQKGTLLFELDNADLLAEHHRLEIELDLARRTAARQAELLRESVTTEAEADAARSAESSLVASLRVLAVTLDKTRIRAPFDGVLGLRRVSEGAWLTPSTPLITISDTSQLKVDFRIPERHARDIAAGARFVVRVDGIAKDFDAHVLAAEPGVDETSRSLLVRGLVEAQGELIPGTFAKVEIPVVNRDALLVPTLAVIPGLSGRSVYLQREGRARLVPVEVGARTPERVQILSGLSAGDRVIVSNLLRLRDGAAVQAVESKP